MNYSKYYSKIESFLTKSVLFKNFPLENGTVIWRLNGSVDQRKYDEQEAYEQRVTLLLVKISLRKMASIINGGINDIGRGEGPICYPNQGIMKGSGV